MVDIPFVPLGFSDLPIPGARAAAESSALGSVGAREEAVCRRAGKPSTFCFGGREVEARKWRPESPPRRAQLPILHASTMDQRRGGVFWPRNGGLLLMLGHYVADRPRRSRALFSSKEEMRRLGASLLVQVAEVLCCYLWGNHNNNSGH